MFFTLESSLACCALDAAADKYLPGHDGFSQAVSGDATRNWRSFLV